MAVVLELLELAQIFQATFTFFCTVRHYKNSDKFNLIYM